MVFIRSLSRQLRRTATQLLSCGSLKPAVTTSPFVRAPVAGTFANGRTLTASAKLQGKVLLILYDVGDNSPNSYAVPMADFKA